MEGGVGVMLQLLFSITSAGRGGECRNNLAANSLSKITMKAVVQEKRKEFCTSFQKCYGGQGKMDWEINNVNPHTADGGKQSCFIWVKKCFHQRKTVNSNNPKYFVFLLFDRLDFYRP